MADTADSVSETPIKIVPWLSFHAALVLTAVIYVLLNTRDVAWPDSWASFEATLATLQPSIKLVVFGIYISMCSTALPMPTSGVVAAVATREVAVGGGLWETVALVSIIGGVGSMIANLSDYHLFNALLRSKRIARIKDTSLYGMASEWFDRSPFWVITVFQILPIPVDVARFLAAAQRYPRWPFALANLLGRGVRYSVIAYATYAFDLGWWAPLVLLVLAAVIGIAKAAPEVLRSRAS